MLFAALMRLLACLTRFHSISVFCQAAPLCPAPNYYLYLSCQAASLLGQPPQSVNKARPLLSFLACFAFILWEDLCTGDSGNSMGQLAEKRFESAFFLLSLAGGVQIPACEVI